MLQVDLQAHEHLSPVVHKDFNEPAVVVWELVLDWQLHLKVLQHGLRFGIVKLLQVELLVVLHLRFLNAVLLLVRDVRGVAAVASAVDRRRTVQFQHF